MESIEKIFRTTLKTGIILLLFISSCREGEQSGENRRRPPQITSPEVHPDNMVTFRFYAPGAESVELSTQFIDGLQAMTMDTAGIWSITLGPVEPDIYPYHFRVDGIQVADPRNQDKFPNEGFQNSLVDIPGDPLLVHSLQNVPHGTVSYRYYHSEELGMRPVVIYTPPGYAENTSTRYPVLYLLHGTTDTEETFTRVGKANLILDNLIAEGSARPMIIVMPYGRAYPVISRESGSLRNWENLQEFSKDFLENIMPFVENNYRVLGNRESNAIAGFSGGGGTSLYIGLSNPESFAWVCGFAPGMRSEEFDRNNAVPFADPELTNSRLKLFWIGVGTEDGLYQVNKEYMELLDEKGIKYTAHITSGGHTWMNVRDYLEEIAQLLFR